jgi:uncharacterized membrane protein YfhO
MPIKDPDYQEIYVSADKNVYKSVKALPRAYFVDSVAVKSSKEFFEALKLGTFNPKKVAFTDMIDFKFDKTDSTVYSKITGYSDERLNVDVNTNGNNFLVFSTNYMPTGWKALIDGAETKIIKTNHTFMGIVVPKGKHKIEFVYAPSNFFIGKYLSLVLNILLLGGLAMITIKRRKEKMSNEGIDGSN